MLLSNRLGLELVEDYIVVWVSFEIYTLENLRQKEELFFKFFGVCLGNELVVFILIFSEMVK
ncbi:hypothetical protein EMIT0P260_50243 [Pseudomonas sp. IT-P260]|nr:hypothetical protein PkP19E3_17065 [Pseudomonas koreensis]